MKKKSRKQKNQTHPAPAAGAAAEPSPQSWCDRFFEYAPLYLLGVAPLVFFRIGGEYDNNPKMAFLQWGVSLLSIAALLYFRKGGTATWKKCPLNPPIILFYVLCLVSAGYAYNPYQGVFFLLQWACAAFFYFFLLNTLHSHRQLMDLWLITVLAALLISAVGIAQKLFGITWVPQLVGPGSTFSNRNMASQYLALIFPLIIGTVFLAPRAWMKTTGIVSLVFSIIFLLYTQTRTAWVIAGIVILATAAIFFLLPPFAGQSRKSIKSFAFWGFCIAAAAVAAIFFFPPVKQLLQIDETVTERIVSIGGSMLNFAYFFFVLMKTLLGSLWIAAAGALLVLAYLIPRISARIDQRIGKKAFLSFGIALMLAGALLWALPQGSMPGKGGTAKLRTIWWLNTLEMVKDNFLFGVGLGNFRIMYPPYHQAVEVDWSFSEGKQLNRVHNDHLQILAETGFSGFCTYAALFIVFFFMFARTYKHGTPDTKLKALFICMGVVCFVLIAMVTFPLERALPPLYLFIYFALMSFLYRSTVPGADRAATIERPGVYVPLRLCLAAAVAVYMSLSVFFFYRIVQSDAYFVQALRLGDKGKIKQANAFLKKAQKFDKWNFNITPLLARNYVMMGKYGKALEQYKKSFRIHPNNINALLNTGYCYLKLNKYEEAKKYFEKFLTIKPDSAKGHNNLGIIYFSLKQHDKAIEHYKKAIELDPSYAEPYYNLANLYRSRGKAEEAIQQYSDAIAANPGLYEARRLLTHLYMQRGDFKKAEQTILPAVQTGSGPVDAHMLLGTIYQESNRYEKALEQYRIALKGEPENGEIYHNIGAVYYYMHKYKAAETALQTALSLNPKLAKSYSMLGQLQLRKKKDVVAEQLLKTALSINPKLAGARFNLGTIYLRRGDAKSARAEYEKTIKCDPRYSLAHYNLATILAHQGEKEKALHHFEQSLKNPSPLIDTALAKKFIADLKKELGDGAE